MAFKFSKHALERIAERGIEKAVVESIIHKPLKETIEEGKKVYHGLIKEKGKQFLIRIFINENVEPNLIITVYKTSKINKYI